MTNIFEGKLIRLRAIEPTDWEFFHRWDAEATDTARMTDEIWFPNSTKSAQDFAANASKHPENDQFRFLIETLDGEPVGTINTHTTNLRNGTFMYGLAVHPDQRRKGYAGEAVRLLLRYFFQERRYQKCTVEVFGFNQPSMLLHEHLGFTLEGRLRRMIYSEGAFHDALLYGITREEFEVKESDEQ